ncbi:MAG: helix-turn-helix domain-containing protein [Candidatus Levybacteria bacterium]|nr:helix-turn-helix domain-containing protein [Candidatus Levybacteria bacterium]
MGFFIETNFLNVKEVSVLLKLSTLTIYRYIAEKKIKAIHFGGRYLIEKSSLNKFMQEKKSNMSF